MAFWQREVFGMTYGEVLTDSIVALAIIIAGIVVGKVVGGILSRAIDRARIEKTKAYNFFKLLVVIIKWSIYVLFLNLAIRVLGIPQFTGWLTDILVIIPAIVGGLLLIIIGFAIAVYLKKLIDESRVESSEVLGQIFFYFIIYVFMIFALKTALISLDSVTVNIIVIVLTGIIGAAIAYRTARVKSGKVSGKK